MSQKTGLLARIAGEMRPSDIPLAPGVDLKAIKDGDEDPLEVVVEVPEGRSKRGWYYTGESLKDIVNKVNSNTLSGFLGHQEPEKIATEFPPPVTHWVGAVWRNGKAYFRGVVDKINPDLKRWIRSKRVKQVSIFGKPKLQTVNGEIRVVGYDAMSIDWTPLDRAGMPTRVVAVGEMDSTFADTFMGTDSTDGEMDGSHEDLRRALYQALNAKLGGEGTYVGVERVFPDHVIAVYEKQGTRRLYRIPYSVQGETVLLGQEAEVERQERMEYVAVGEMKGDDGEMKSMNEMLAAIRSAIAKGDLNLQTVFGEMGVTKEMGVQALVGDEFTKAKTGAEFGTKLAATLGFTPDMSAESALTFAGEMAGLCKTLGLIPGADVSGVKTSVESMRAVWNALGFDKNVPANPAEVAGEMAKVYREQSKIEKEKLIDKVIGQKVSGEMAQGVVKMMLKVEDTATEEQIAGEIDALLSNAHVKGLIGGAFVDQSAGTGVTGSQSAGTKQNVRAKTVSI